MTRESKKKFHDEHNSKAGKLNRRTFVKLVPALSVAAVTIPDIATKSLAQNPTPTPTPVPTASPTPLPLPPRHQGNVTRRRTTLRPRADRRAETNGAANVNTNLDRYETLRKIEVPLDTEPATLFHPALPGKKFNIKQRKLNFSKTEAPRSLQLKTLLLRLCRSLLN